MVVDAALTGLVVLGFAGWAWTLVALMRHLLPMANAVGALHKVDALIDDRIARVLTRVQERAAPPVIPNPKPTEGDRNQGAADALRSIFGTTALVEPIGDQPDADELEVVN